MTYKEKQKFYIERTDTALYSYLSKRDMPGLLRESMLYSVRAGGKRLRPCLTLSACELIGGDIELALPYACALELIHTYSLIHDDLPAMDDDDLRRGQPSNHIVFGEGQAILAGDALLTYAFEILLENLTHNNALNFIMAARAIANGAGVTGMLLGQTLDLMGENVEKREAGMLYKIHEGKTGALIRACVEAGAYCANAEDERLSALISFAAQYGLLFQITDDILDVIGDVRELGKNTGKDAKKLTFPAIFGIDGAKERAGEAARKAKSSLNIFGDKAWYFVELIDLTLTRKA